MAAEELVVVLSKRNDSGGLGFSLLGLAGLPHTIYDIGEHSAAAESGQVEAGDIILRVNDTDVSRFTTKEVLKCIRLSKDPVRLTLKRDPVMKARVLRHVMTASHSQETDDMCDLISSSSSTTSSSSHSTRSSKIPRPRNTVKQNNGSAIPNKSQGCAVTSPILKERNGSDGRKVGSASEKGADKNEFEWEPLGGPTEKADKSGPPRFEAYMMTGDLILNLSRTQQSSVFPKYQKKVDSLLLRRHHNYNNNHQHHNSVPTSPNECDMGVRSHKIASSPTCNSAGASPVGASKHDMFEEACNSTSAAGNNLSYHHSVRTSRSEDQLQKDCSMSTVDIDIDEDVTSSLNTLLDTRSDSRPSSRPEYHHHDIEKERCLEMFESDSQQSRITRQDSASACQQSASFTCKGTCQGTCGGECQSSRRNEFAGARSDSGADSVSGAAANSTSDLIKTYGDRIVWTYNAPDWWIRLHGDRMPRNVEELEQCRREMSSSSSGGSETRDGIGSPTSVSSSVMSSNSSNFERSLSHPPVHHNGELSQSEGVSNISSPDFQEEETLDILSARDLLMEASDPSDSDSTLMANTPRDSDSVHRIVIEVKNSDGSPQRGKNSRQQAYQELRESEESSDKAVSPPLSSEDESDIESLHSYHYSPKGVDLPSAIRLAKRLFSLDGFKKSDISKHLSKNNDFSRAVAEEYLKHFNFTGDSLDTALRKFLKQFSLAGETQERERVLVHFSKRYLDCNPGSFNSQDAVHTLTCALMLLNTDLHSQNVGRKMACSEFIDNLAELNDGENFPSDVLKMLYQAIKCCPLEWALDVDVDECTGVESKQQQQQSGLGLANLSLGANPFLDVPNTATAIEYKKGYVMRKCCIDPNGKKTPFGKRGWRMYYCTLRDLVLYLHKDEHGFRKSQLSDNLHNAIRIHHALATKANDYTKKQHVFRLQTADQAEYLFQTSDSKELQSWIDTINFVCASFSAQPLASAVGSQRKFQRPLLPCSHTKLNLREQLRDHEDRVLRLEAELEELRKTVPERGSKGLNLHSYKDKDAYLHSELKRYKTYAYLLRSRMSQYPELVDPSLEDSRSPLKPTEEYPLPMAIMEEDMPTSPHINRYSYRAAIYNSSTAGRNGVDSYAAEIG